MGRDGGVKMRGVSGGVVLRSARDIGDDGLYYYIIFIIILDGWMDGWIEGASINAGLI